MEDAASLSMWVGSFSEKGRPGPCPLSPRDRYYRQDKRLSFPGSPVPCPLSPVHCPLSFVMGQGLDFSEN